jgi:hypothetical protein
MLFWLTRYQALPILSSPTLLGQVRYAANNMNMLSPKVISAEELPVSEAKSVSKAFIEFRLTKKYLTRWITLKKLKWSDPDGKEVSE